MLYLAMALLLFTSLLLMLYNRSGILDFAK